MTNKEQIEELKKQVDVLRNDVDDLCIAIGNIMSIIDNLRYRRIPDLERRLEHGTNNNNNR